ncbi:acetate--CoA ligase family protein [Niveispirillum sp.]|uniref:acetate--CoA ligase family protein n=1 Tax=Niveispirillum sp. TaxID=1917217 RepID=UPI001B56164C|nr:acetate--CoA ligase family protein [Niveispirillum sp.]MBP7334358.1 acetate--CoA ligase family protein [Niveispirillum sp.]
MSIIAQETPLSRSVYTNADLRRLIDPASVTIVGLSRNEKSFGARTAANLSGFTGRTWGVNPNAAELYGIPCFSGLSALPAVPDCAVLAVPVDAVLPLVEECAALGVGGCVIYASGFAETGLAERIDLQNRLAAIARGSQLRIVGPNCIGLINNISRAGLSFAAGYGARRPAAGPVAIVSQSGGLGQALAQVAERGGSYSHFMAAGNSCDVDVCDYVSYLADDPGCSVITCIAEGLKDGERLLQAGERALAAGKPIVMYKIATGTAAAKAAMSHTGTLAGANAAYEAAYRRLGIVQVDNIEDVYETAAFLAKAGRPGASGVAAVAASGGACVITLDKAEQAGVPMPRPAPATQAVLNANVPDFGNPSNPCDITAQVATNPASYAACLEAMLADPGYAAVLVMAPSISEPGTPNNVALFSGLAAKAGKPLCLSWMSEWKHGPGAAAAEADPHVALFRSTAGAYRTLAAWLERERRITGPAPRARGGSPNPAAMGARALLAAAGERLTEREAKEVLAAYGIPVATDHVVQDADAAVAAADRLGYPVVLKLETPDIAHKTEAGVVRLDLRDATAVRGAFAAIMDAAGRVEPAPRIVGILVQPMIAPGLEIVVGSQLDPTFGPMVVVGLGGIMVELLHDSAAELAPVNHQQARAMLDRLKGAALLRGFRGQAGADIDRLAGIIVALSELAADLSDLIAEIDVNPIICGPGRAIAVDALIVRR